MDLLLDISSSERAIISILLLYPDQFDKISSVLDEGDFSDVSLKMVYNSFKKFSENENKWTWLLVADYVKTIDDRPMDLEFPLSYLSSLVSVPKLVLDNVDFYLKVLLERKCRIGVGKAITDFSESLKDTSKNVNKLSDEFFEIGGLFGSIGFGKHRVVTNINLWEELKKDIVELSTTKFIGTGYNSIDRSLTWGFAPGQVSIITGRPSMGKSTFRTNIQRNMADIGIHTITVSKEQSIRQEYFRLIALKTGLSIQSIRRVNDWKEGEDFEKITGAIKQMSGDWPHTIIEPIGKFYLHDLKRVVIEDRAKGNDPKVIFVDLFSQLDDINSASPSYKAVIIQQKLIDLASVAKEIKVHFCLVVQLSRLGKDREKIDPREHLKESGAYEERADLLFQIDRPGYYKPDEIEDNRVNINILKQRDGEVKRFNLCFNKKTLLIKEDSVDVENMEENDKGLFRPFKKE